MFYPDYENCLVNVSNSLLKYYGLENGHPSLEVLDRYLEKGYKNVVWLVLDGFGSQLIQDNLGEGSFLGKHQVSQITSVFPPTTAAATTSIVTGKTPVEHGWLGWELYFESVDQVVTTFFNTLKKNPKEQAASYHLAQRELVIKTIISRMNQLGNIKGHWISPFPKDTLVSADASSDRIDLINYDFRNLDTLFNQLENLCQGSEKKFIYAYSMEPDSLMHELGTKDIKVVELMKYLDKKVAQLCENLEDTLLIVTSDHGHIDAGGYFFLSDYPELKNMLVRETSIEPRAVNFFVKDGLKEAFSSRFNELFGKDFLLLSKREVLEKQLFGPGAPHKKFESFLGDFLAIGITDKGILDEFHPNPKKGFHAGGTLEEMMVPLIIIEKEK